MKSVTISDWLAWHPYTEPEEVDLYYMGLAEDVRVTLSKLEVAKTFMDGEGVKCASVCIAAWMEDIVSDLGIWRTFAETCREIYGYYLPFYPTGEAYRPGGLNEEDVRFLLWQHVQYMWDGDRLVDPRENAILEGARQVYALLTRERENALVNERMQVLMREPDFDENDFQGYLRIAEWFHFHCYFSAGNQDELNSRVRMGARLRMGFAYGELVDRLFRGRQSPLSLCTHEWLARIWKNTSQSDLYTKVRCHDGNIFLYEGEDEDFVYVRDMGSDEELKVVKESMRTVEMRKPEETMIFCMLIYYGGVWWQQGELMEGCFGEKMMERAKELSEIMADMEEWDLVNDFRRASGGKAIVFCRTGQEALAFFERMKYDLGSAEVKQWEETEGSFLMMSPLTGLYTRTDYLECLKLPDNPFYNEEMARANAFRYMKDMEFIPYELACELQDLGALDDASLEGAKSTEEDRQFMRTYSRFMMDYQYHRSRPKDYDHLRYKKQENG